MNETFEDVNIEKKIALLTEYHRRIFLKHQAVDMMLSEARELFEKMKALETIVTSRLQKPEEVSQQDRANMN